MKDKADAVFTLELSREKSVGRSYQENVQRVWEHESAARFDGLEAAYNEGLLRLFELYAPFAELIASQLPAWFADALPDQGLRQDCHRLVDQNQPRPEGKTSPAMLEAMLRRVEDLKQSSAFDLLRYLAWLVFLLALMPAQLGATDAPAPARLSVSLCDVAMADKIAASLLVLGSYYANAPLLSKHLLWLVAGLLAVGFGAQLTVVLRRPSTFSLALAGCLAAAKLLFLVSSWRVGREAVRGCAGGAEEHARAYEEELSAAFKGGASALDGNRAMQDVGDILYFAV